MRILTKIKDRIIGKRKPKWAALCTHIYTDKIGRKYYAYNDELDMPILRKGEIEKHLLELRYGSDFEDVLIAMKKALSLSDKKGNIKPDLVMIGYLIQELLSRKEFLVIPEIMFRIVITILIREDETPYTIDAEISDEKMDIFKREMQDGGLADFFHSTGLLKYVGLSHISTIDLRGLMKGSQQLLKKVNQIVFSFNSTLQDG